jgi:hypothetical protein
MTIGGKLIVCFAALLMAALGFGYQSWSSTARLGGLLDAATNRMVRKLELCGQLGKTLSDMGSLERAVTLRMSMNDRETVERYKQTFVAKMAEAGDVVKEYRPLLASEAARQALDSIQADLGSRLGRVSIRSYSALPGPLRI